MQNERESSHVDPFEMVGRRAHLERIDEAEIRRHERGRCLAVLLEMVSEGRIGAGSNAMLAAIEGIRGLP